jgi:hypothetical protein
MTDLPMDDIDRFYKYLLEDDLDSEEAQALSFEDIYDESLGDLTSDFWTDDLEDK